MEPLLARAAEAAGLVLTPAQLTQLGTYGRLIEKWNRVVNLVGSGSIDAIVRAHLGDCLAAIPFIEGPRLADIGSGAGLPGLVIAIARPEFSVVLIESRQRKCRFLRQTVIELGLLNVSVFAARIEHWQAPHAVDAITCRGYSSLAKFLTDTRALHHPGLRLYAMKGAIGDAEIDAVAAARQSIDVRRLHVPGWDHRHLVTISLDK
jgi:16S rRNA (guanine527-N7)-methyltransferase